MYAGLGETTIDYYPQKGLYTAISYAFTDLILLASMLVLALLLVRQERDSGLLSLVRSLPGGRLQTALAKLGAFALSLLAVLALLYGVNLAYCAATFGLGPLTRTIQSVPALMRCTMQITVGQYLFRFLLAKWVGAFVMGLWVMLAALVARRAAAGWAAALAGPLVMFGIRAAIPATSRLNVIKYANLASLLQPTNCWAITEISTGLAPRSACRSSSGRRRSSTAGRWGSASAGCLPARSCCLRQSADLSSAGGTRRTPLLSIRKKPASCCFSTARRLCLRRLSGSAFTRA